uniref:Uncharacterized protein n=1 Tax=viral metagenome TaxID=1070528 RepID=A0A6C0AF24_9ZZZZ
MNLNIINNTEFSWLKNSEFYRNLNQEDLEDLDIKYCSIHTEDINLFLNVGHFWGVNHYPKEFFSLVFKNKPIKHLKKLYDLTHSFFYSLLISLISMSPKNFKNKMSFRAIKYNYIDLLDYSEISNIRLYNIACKYNRFEIIKFLFEKKLPFHHSSMNWAVYYGRFEILQFFSENNALFSEKTTKQACIKGHLEILKYLHEKGCPWNENSVISACRKGHLEILKYLHEKGCPWDYQCIISAYQHGHFDCLKYLHENNCPSIENLLNNFGVCKPNLKILKYLHEKKGYLLGEYIFHSYLKYKNFACIKYIESKIGFPESQHLGAARHLKIIKYFHKKGAVLDEICFKSALYTGILKNIKYFVENNCPLIFKDIEISTIFGGINVLKYYREEIIRRRKKIGRNKKFKWNEQIFKYACETHLNNFECIKYIIEDGFVLKKDLFKKLCLNKSVRLETLVFLNELVFNKP